MSRRQEKRRERLREAGEAQSRIWTWFVVPTIVVAAVLCYGRSLTVEFLFDDYYSRPGDRQPAGEEPWWLFPPADSPVAGRPLSAFTMAVNFRASAYKTASYHVFNTAVHAANAVLLWALLRRTLRTPAVAPSLQARAEPLAAVCAIVWLVHPLATEVVIYIVQRTELLVAMFYLGVMYCAVRAWGSPRATAWSAAAVGCGLLGALSKEVIATVPLMVALYDRAFLAPSWREAFSQRWKLYAALTSIWALLALLMIDGPRSQSVGYAHGFSAWDYLQSQAVALVEYLRLSLWPVGLCIDYGPLHRFPLAQTAACGAVVLLLLGLTTWAYVRRPAVGFLGAWFFVILGPTSSVVPIVTEWCAERRAYLPLAAVVVGVVIGVVWLWERYLPAAWRGRSPAAGFGAAAAVVAVLAMGTARRAEVYRDTLALFADAVHHDPENNRARANYGGALLFAAKPENSNSVDQGFARQAAEQYEILVERDDANPGYHHNCAMALMYLNRPRDAEAHFRRALELDPNYLKPLNEFAGLLFAEARYVEALANYRKLAKLEPGNFNWHYNVGLTLMRMGRGPEVREALETASSLAATDDQLVAAAKQWAELGDNGRAAALLQRALQINPGNAVAAAMLR